MYQLKTICDKPEKLEYIYNQFFKEHPNIEVVKMTQCQSGKYNHVTLTILYIQK